MRKSSQLGGLKRKNKEITILSLLRPSPERFRPGAATPWPQFLLESRQQAPRPHSRAGGRVHSPGGGRRLSCGASEPAVFELAEEVQGGRAPLPAPSAG
jgi:hypothetical protein